MQVGKVTSTKYLGWIAAAIATASTVALFVLILLMSPARPNIWPATGVYHLTDDVRSEISISESGSLDFTISGNRIDEVLFKNLDIGVAGIGTVFEISASSGTIRIDTMTADGLVCPRFLISDTTIFDARYLNNVSDGADISFAGGSPQDVTVQSDRGAKDRISEDNTYDKIKMSAASDALIRSLTIKDVHAFGGYCLFSDMEIGRLIVMNSRIGSGDGIAVKDFGFGSGVTIGAFNQTGDTEAELAVR